MPRYPAPWWARRRKIQLPYINTFKTIWEYEESFLARRIDFSSSIGPECPLCGGLHCCRQISPYLRYAIELFPEFKKKRIPVARFLCRKTGKTFSLLPFQLIPYFQYTLSAVLGTLLLGLGCRQTGQRGFHGASVQVDPESLVTPWLVARWLMAVLKGLQRAHAVLGRWYDLNAISIAPQRAMGWEEVSAYLLCFGWNPQLHSRPVFCEVLHRYSRTTKRFLFGIPSQERIQRSTLSMNEAR